MVHEMLTTLFNCTAYGRLGRSCRLSFYSSILISTSTCFAAIIVGIWVLVCKRFYSVLFEPVLYVSVAYILLIVGIFSILATVVGSYATNKELRCLMCSFSIASLILCLMLGIGGIMGFIFQMQLSGSALDLQMLTALQNLYGEPNYASMTAAFDSIQENFQCCGVDNNNDNFMIWRTSKWHMDDKNTPKRSVPLSCCVKDPNENNKYVDAIRCQYTDFKQANDSYVHIEGCYDRFAKDLMRVSTIEGCFGIAASISLLPPAFFAAFLAKLIQK